MHEYDDEGRYVATSGRRADAETWPFPGRHESHREIADETPIFHALTVGGWRSRRTRGASGRAVRSVHRPTTRTASTTGDTVAAFHDDPLGAAVVPAQTGTRRRRDAERAADRAAIAHLLDGAGRHRLGSPV